MPSQEKTREIADHVWSIEEIAALVPEPMSVPREPYKKRATN
jgi:hypothetical protein